MASLIKLPRVEGKTMLLLDAVTARPVAMAPVERSATTQAESLESSSPVQPISPTPPAIPTQESLEKAAYDRWMAQYKEALSSLEEETRKKAYAAGYADGEKAGHATGLARGDQDGAEKYAAAVTALERIASAGENAIAEGLLQAETLIGAIVFQAVCKIVGEALQTPEGVYAVVQQTISDARKQDLVSIKVAPADLEMLLEHQAALQPGLSRLQAIGLEIDESIELGGCIVQLKGGHIDARIETQFRSFAQSLKDAAQGRG